MFIYSVRGKLYEHSYFTTTDQQAYLILLSSRKLVLIIFPGKDKINTLPSHKTHFEVHRARTKQPGIQQKVALHLNTYNLYRHAKSTFKAENHFVPIKLIMNVVASPVFLTKSMLHAVLIHYKLHEE